MGLKTKGVILCIDLANVFSMFFNIDVDSYNCFVFLYANCKHVNVLLRFFKYTMKHNTCCHVVCFGCR